MATTRTEPLEPLTVSVEQAGRLLGISRDLAYDAAKSGQLGTVRIGRRLVVPRGAIDDLLRSGSSRARPAERSGPAAAEDAP